jgi:hypothetical protein
VYYVLRACYCSCLQGELVTIFSYKVFDVYYVLRAC